MDQDTFAGEAAPVVCRQCGQTLTTTDAREVTAGGVFCAPCFTALAQHVKATIRRQGEDINHANAALGGVAGGLLGALVWWGFTALTHVSFGLVAVVIGYLVGRGVVMASGGKRAPSLQVISVLIAAVAYGYASYLVQRTFLLKAIADDPALQAAGARVPLFAPPAFMFDVLRAGFQVFDLVFLAIVVYQAWKMPAPLTLGR